MTSLPEGTAAAQPEELANTTYFGVCPECRRGGVVQFIGKANFMTCDPCATAWYIGTNIISRGDDRGWLDAEAEMAALKASYRPVDPIRVADAR